MVSKKVEEKIIISEKETVVEVKKENKEPQTEVKQSPVHGFYRG